ncbi:hypothetical protein [Streptacidiphilus albus]|uniref:hypothetical protein n=1 Tax=Streptacidiphilus albus TaxID=105425 RepID=UPI00054B67EA|nr:hypothetical protein [Streptacidiphilus albus]
MLRVREAATAGVVDRINASIPLGRMAEPHEVADVAAAAAGLSGAPTRAALGPETVSWVSAEAPRRAFRTPRLLLPDRPRVGGMANATVLERVAA